MKLSRRSFLQLSATAGAGLLLPRPLRSAIASPLRPNVIVIIADDLGYGDLACYGNPDLRTPCIDQLAAGGVRLSQHYSGAPLCSPARAALLTGRYSHHVGAISVESNRGLDRISLQDATLGDHFQTAGYATGLVGKWHNGLYDRRYLPNARGFKEVAGFYNGGMGYNDWILDYNGTTRKSDGRYLTDVFADEASQFIERHQREPFMLYVAFNAPHVPLEAPAEEVAPYQATGKFNDAVSTLYGMITRMDRGVGRMLEKLKRVGLDENTIVIFTSDHGPLFSPEGGSDEPATRFNGPFRGNKQDVLEGGIRVPGIVRWPAGLPHGTVSSDQIHSTDWLPTLLAATQVKRTGGKTFDGINQLAALRGKAGPQPARFWQYNRYTPVVTSNAAMRDGDWKLYVPKAPKTMAKLASDNVPYKELYHRPHFEMEIDRSAVPHKPFVPVAPQLYNIAADPGEAKNLAAEQPTRVSEMKNRLETWFDRMESERHQLPEYAGHGV